MVEEAAACSWHSYVLSNGVYPYNVSNLFIGYHNVQMFIFRPFLAYLTQNPKGEQGQTRVPEAQRLLEMAAKKCLYSARKTVDIIYDTFRQYSFFRCWYVRSPWSLLSVK